MSKYVTPKTDDYNKWYTDVITRAELADYGPVKGTMVIRPYGFEIWEHIKEEFDLCFKNTGHVNAYFPLLIPKSYLSKEADHVEGFAKECAIITHSRLKSAQDGGGVVVDPESKLEEEVIIRPTSETVIWSMYKKWINSYRDLPILINQWANVVRWEMRTRLFLRTSEFLWQEGHTAHTNEQEARDETLMILEIYRSVCENILAIPVLTGLKSESERFAGAVDTYCIEAMMGDKKALQAGTSHYLGQNFAKAFDVKFQDENNKEQYVYATSWGVSTRLIGALIMVHGDEKGLRLPPKIAPIQLVIIPIFKNANDLKKIQEFLSLMFSDLEKNKIRFYFDIRSKISPGFKFNEWELKGVPMRMEVGPRDMDNNTCIIARRDKNKKESLNISGSIDYILEQLEDIQINLFQEAKSFRDHNTYSVQDFSDFQSKIKKGGFLKCNWDGDSITEKDIKEKTQATIRCILPGNPPIGSKCIYSKKPAKYQVVFAKAY